MAKKTDPFDRFREATLGGGNTLGAALTGAGEGGVERRSSSPLPSPAPAKKSKNSDRSLKSFHIDNAMFKKLGLIKYETGLSYDQLYNEAIADLLVKYGKA